MSDTPRTDAEYELVHNAVCACQQDVLAGHEDDCLFVFPEFGMKVFAQELERELIAMTKERDELQKNYDDLVIYGDTPSSSEIAALINERDELRKDCIRLASLLNQITLRYLSK